MIAIVCPVHNRKEVTRRFLECVENQQGVDLSVIVVDDGSTDGTAEMLRDDFGWVDVVRGDGTWWWTASVNAGIKRALDRGVEAILLMNDDTLPERDFVARLQQGASDPGGLYCAVETEAVTGEVRWGGSRTNWCTGKTVGLAATLPESERRGPHIVSYLPGRSMLVPADVYQSVGLFDADSLPHLAADYDFSLRAQRAGHELYCNWDVFLPCPPESPPEYSWGGYWEHLTGTRGRGNLRIFLRYAARNSPGLCVVPFVTLGIARRIVGYPRAWLVSRRSEPVSSGDAREREILP